MMQWGRFAVPDPTKCGRVLQERLGPSMVRLNNSDATPRRYGSLPGSHPEGFRDPWPEASSIDSLATATAQISTGRRTIMSSISTKDGTRIFYKDHGSGPPVVFSHGWPLSADAWDAQMVFLGQRDYRVIAHDRRSHGRSDQTWDGNNMDQYADDLAELFEQLNLHDAVLVGHSTGGGEVAHYLGRHGTRRVTKAVLLSSVPPLMLKTELNPGGLPLEVFDGLRKSPF